MISKQLDRREFLRAVGIAGVVAGAGGTPALLASCSGATTSDGGKIATGVGPAAAALQPGNSIEGTIYGDIATQLPKGGSLDITLTASAATLDILSSTLGAIQWYADPVHDALERFNQRGQLVPSLAQRLELVNPTTYRYTLHDAKFHNGRKVVAADVVKTVEYVRSPTLGSNRSGYFENVKVHVVDDQTVEFVLAEPNSGFRYYLPGLPIVPTESADQLAHNPIGCGPYRFKQWVKDSYIDYEANRDYWNSDLPRLDRLRLTLRTDPQAATQAMQAGQTDVLDTVPAAQISQFQQIIDSGKLKGVSYAGGWSFVGLNTRKGPLRDPRVRRALALALDRKAIARVSGGSLSVPMCTAPYSPIASDYPKDLEYQRDLQRARDLLHQAGVESLSLDVMTINATYAAIGTVVKSNWNDIGVFAKLQQVDAPTWVSRRTQGEFQVAISGWFTSPEPSYVLDNLFSSNGTSNFWGYRSEVADSLIKKGRTTFESGARKRVYHDLMKLLFIDEPSAIPICSENGLMTFKPEVNGADIAPSALSMWRYPIAAKRET